MNSLLPTLILKLIKIFKYNSFIEALLAQLLISMILLSYQYSIYHFSYKTSTFFRIQSWSIHDIQILIIQEVMCWMNFKYLTFFSNTIYTSFSFDINTLIKITIFLRDKFSHKRGLTNSSFAYNQQQFFSLNSNVHFIIMIYKNTYIKIYYAHVCNIQNTHFLVYLIIILLRMNKVIPKNLDYMSGDFIKAVNRFQQIVDLLINDPYQIDEYTVYGGPRQKLQKITTDQLVEGKNKRKIIEFSFFRILENDHSTYLLVAESNAPHPVDQFLLLVVLCPSELIKKWNKESPKFSKLLVKEINVQGKINNEMNVCVSRVQNIILQPSNKRQSPLLEEVKNKSRQLFNNKKFYDAFMLYQIGLSTHLNTRDKRNRAILYANSSACLFQMRAYQSSVAYGDVAIRVDRQYPKGYAKKIFPLLEMNRLSEIPSLLVNLQSMIDAYEFEKIYKKYTIYLVNNIGQYNWKQFFACECNLRQQFVFGQYQSDKIDKISLNKNIIYFAKQQIQPYQLLLIKKPIMFKKYNENQCQQSAVDQFKSFAILEQTYKRQICKLCEHFRKYQDKSKSQRQILQDSFDKLIYKQKKRSKNDGKGLGLWSDMYYFQQKCDPNCSFVSNRNLLLVSSTKQIKAGSPLTLDYASMEPPKQRKKFLKNTFGIQCNCKICRWQQWPQNIDNIQQVINLISNLNNLKMIKQLICTVEQQYSLFMDDKKSDGYNIDILTRFLTAMQKNVQWEDLVNLAKIMQNKKVPKIRKILELSISSGLSKFLKLQPQQCIPFIPKLL